MKVLIGCAGLGGVRNLWEDVEVTAVEIDPKIAAIYQELHPDDKVIVGDFYQYLLDHYEEYDFIEVSPECPTHSRMAKATRHKKRSYPDMKLYQVILFLQHFFKGKWVVENVVPYYEPLIKPTVIIGRHLFWSNFPIKKIDAIEQPKGFINTATVKGSEELKKWLGISYEGNIYHKGNHCPGQVLRNCIHPKLGLHILNCAMGKKPEMKLQNTLF